MDYYENQTYYDVLGVSEDASLYNIERAKNRLIFSSSADRAPIYMWDKILEAYNVLSDQEKRSAYDKYLEAQRKLSQKGIVDPTREITENPDKIDLNYAVPFSEKKAPLATNKQLIAGTVVSLVLGGPALGAVVAIALNVILRGKYRTYKFNNPGHIKAINTEESSLIEKYNKKLENEINKLLSQPHNSYKLEILKTRYSNEIELLRQRINLKKSMKSKSKLESINHKFKLNALENQLKTAERKLEDINNKIDNYERENKLSKINRDLMKNNKKLETMKNEGFNPSSIHRVQLYSDKLLEKRNLTASRFKVKTFKSLSSKVLVARDFMKAARDTLFENKPEVEEESTQKTR